MFELLFYSLLVISSFTLLKAFIGPKWWKPRYVIGKIFKGTGLVLVSILTLILWSVTVLEATAPKGTLLHEVARLPKHYFLLRQQKTDSLSVDRISYGPHSNHYMLICRDKKSEAKPSKIIFFVHGGGWHVGRPESHLKLAEKLATEGYVVLMPAYRKGPIHDYEEINNDMTLALKAALMLQKEQNWTEIPFILGGTSAGGNLAALLLYDKERLNSLGINQDYFSGLFSLAGALDIERMNPTFVLKRYAGTPKDSKFYDANPVCHIDQNEHIPVLCIQGAEDGLVQPEAAESFVSYLRTIDSNMVEYHKIPGATHMDITSSWYYNKSSDFGQTTILLNWLKGSSSE